MHHWSSSVASPFLRWPVWTALVTPLKDDGSICQNTLLMLARRQEAAGNGIVLFGSTGEGTLLCIHEKKQALMRILAERFHVPIMVGIPPLSMREAEQWLRLCEEIAPRHPASSWVQSKQESQAFHAEYPHRSAEKTVMQHSESCGDVTVHERVWGYMLSTPAYIKAGCNGQKMWFQRLLSLTKKPCMFYNVPSRTGVRLYEQVLADLQRKWPALAVKSAGSPHDAQAYAAYHVPIFSGNDDEWGTQASLYVGLVSVIANAFPWATRLWVAMHKSPSVLASMSEISCTSTSLQSLCESHGTLCLQTLHRLMHAACAWHASATNPLSIKMLLHHMALLPSTALCPPLCMQDAHAAHMALQAASWVSLLSNYERLLGGYSVALHDQCPDEEGRFDAQC